MPSAEPPAAASAPPSPPAVVPAAAVSPRRPDPRRWIYGGLDLVLATIYFVSVVWLVPNRLPLAQAHLLALPVLAALMGVGALLGRRVGWWLSAGAAGALLLAAIVLIARILVSAAYLAGVYGALGRAASTFALIGAALVIEVVALLPVFQLKYLMTRAGRRAFGLAPVAWNRPAP